MVLLGPVAIIMALTGCQEGKKGPMAGLSPPEAPGSAPAGGMRLRNNLNLDIHRVTFVDKLSKPWMVYYFGGVKAGAVSQWIPAHPGATRFFITDGFWFEGEEGVRQGFNYIDEIPSAAPNQWVEYTTSDRKLLDGPTLSSSPFPPEEKRPGHLGWMPIGYMLTSNVPEILNKKGELEFAQLAKGEPDAVKEWKQDGDILIWFGYYASAFRDVNLGPEGLDVHYRASWPGGGWGDGWLDRFVIGFNTGERILGRVPEPSQPAAK
jgi:hypothetical protein